MRLLLGWTLILAGFRMIYIWAQSIRIDDQRRGPDAPCDCKGCREGL